MSEVLIRIHLDTMAIPPCTHTHTYTHTHIHTYTTSREAHTHAHHFDRSHYAMHTHTHLLTFVVSAPVDVAAAAGPGSDMVLERYKATSRAVQVPASLKGTQLRARIHACAQVLRGAVSAGPDSNVEGPVPLLLWSSCVIPHGAVS